MTMVGGKMGALQPSLANEWGVEAVGHEYNFDDSQLDWIGQPFTDEGKREAGLLD